MVHSTDPLAERASRWLPEAILALVILGAIVSVRPVLFPGRQRPLYAAASAYVHGRHAEAERLAQEYLQQVPDSSPALLIAGEAAVKLQEDARALDYFSRVPQDGTAYGLRALFGRAQRLLRAGRAREAEESLRRVVQAWPTFQPAVRELVYILEVEGRTWEALPYLWQIIRSGRMGGDYLLMAGSADSISLSESTFVARCLSAVPDDPLPLLGQARELMRTDAAAAEVLLRRIIRHDPSIVEAQARLGRILLDADREPEFLKWHEELPADIGEHPDLWLDRGLWAARNKQWRAAARCFWEALRLHPNHGPANHHLSQALSVLGDKQAAQECAERARCLARVEIALRDLGAGDDVFRQVAQDMEVLGRQWEAVAWYQSVLHFHAPPAWAQQELKRATCQLSRASFLTAAEACPATKVDLSSYPLPTFGARVLPAAAEVDRSFPNPRFVDIAQAAGLDFQYFNGADKQAERAYMFEFQGGGVAVLDYDNDGWPDLYLTQGCRWPAGAGQESYRDRLFRNLGDGRFADVTESAGLGDQAFSGGVTVGDFDNDGWPDLYVGNIGPNRLYRNNADGTFSDATELSGTAGSHWTTGAALADFNQDGLPDLYVLNYLAGDVLERACTSDGLPIQCGPTLFPGEQDRCYRNLGDGRFQDVTDRCGIVGPDGKGLGLLVADFDNSGRLGIFVANDTTANFLFRNETAAPGSIPRFTEEGLLSGLAFDGNGAPQASMGIAAGDANGDGLLDLFVTDFYREASAFYIQNPDHSFSDQVRPAGMYESSVSMLGWGTQFLDAQLDGLPDLVLTNGHINDFRAKGIPYQMRCQSYRNLGEQRFEETPAAELGSYFSKQQLGRALARLDWNRDGREDFCVTHVDEPVSLLENETSPTGHFVSVRLVGVTGARDAIGARLQLSIGEHTWHRQLTAGDGFQASNERRIVFGLGAASGDVEVQVTWPGGKVEIFRELPLDAEVTLVEGRSLNRPSIARNSPY
jgi:tetratricopeptide (TPR) repeat protein